MIKVNVISHFRKGEFQQQLNAKLNELQENGCEIIDVKFSSSLSGEYVDYGALIVYKEAKND